MRIAIKGVEKGKGKSNSLGCGMGIPEMLQRIHWWDNLKLNVF